MRFYGSEVPKLRGPPFRSGPIGCGAGDRGGCSFDLFQKHELQCAGIAVQINTFLELQLQKAEPQCAGVRTLECAGVRTLECAPLPFKHLKSLIKNFPLSYDLLGSKKSTPGRTGAPARKLASGRSGVDFLPRTAQPAVLPTLRTARPSLARSYFVPNAAGADGVGQAGRGRFGLSRPARVASPAARSERSEGWGRNVLHSHISCHPLPSDRLPASHPWPRRSAVEIGLPGAFELAPVLDLPPKLPRLRPNLARRLPESCRLAVVIDAQGVVEAGVVGHRVEPLAPPAPW